jgi:NAD(P)-dependent dehydrogenase (short-subunit alcohol dehydrogenase family)
MRVLITGGAGLIGRAAAQRLVNAGWDVRLVGLETDIEIAGAEYATCDILNYDDLRKQMKGCEAVIHLAAIRGPQLAPASKLFEVNVAGTFNVFEAAAAEGIRRVVQASSINALGAVWGLTDMDIKYLPIDEAHPTFTTDPYSFSKEMIEDIGRYYWRRDGISSVALRFPAVYPHGNIQTAEYRARRQANHRIIDEFAALDETTRQNRLAEIRQRSDAYRQQRPMEYREGSVVKWSQRDAESDALWHIYNFDRFNFWAFIDERDAAQSLEKGVTADYEGAHVLFVNDDHNSLGYDSRTLARLFFPEISDSAVALSGSASLVSIENARNLIGFEPEYSVANWDNAQTEKQA